MELAIGFVSCAWIMYTGEGVIDCWRHWYVTTRFNRHPRTRRRTLAGALLGTALLFGASVCLWHSLP
jgi:hypothetical protein